MDHPVGAGLQLADRVDFDPRVRLEFRGAQISSDGGLLVMPETDDALGLSDLASVALCDNRRGKDAAGSGAHPPSSRRLRDRRHRSRRKTLVQLAQSGDLGDRWQATRGMSVQNNFEVTKCSCYPSSFDLCFPSQLGCLFSFLGGHYS